MNIWVILFVVALVFVVGVIIFLIAESTLQLDLPPGPSCYVDAECGQINICINGLCKAPIGASCQSIGDCVTEAVACTNGICIAPIGEAGDSCPCKENFECINGICKGLIGTSCNDNEDCISSICFNGVCVEEALVIEAVTSPVTTPIPEDETSEDYTSPVSTPDETPEYTSKDDGVCISSYDCPDNYICAPRCVYQGYGNGKILPLLSKKYQHGENALDLTVHRDVLYILLEGGDLIKIKDKMAIRQTSDLPLESILSFNHTLYGLASGHLYSYESEEWHLVDSLPGNITHMSSTLNTSHLWLKCGYEGYLYDRDWQVITREERCGDKRHYGIDINTYTDLQAGVKTCAYFPDGYLLSYNKESNIYLVKVVFYQGSYIPMFIMERGCVPQ